MTKQANRASAINERRKSALARMKPETPKKAQSRESAEREYLTLAKRVIAGVVAAVRTKKDRTARGKFTR